MKKQLFTLMMAFALVLGLSVSAFAQTGLTAATATEVAVGSRLPFTITPGDVANTILWEVGSITTAAAEGSALVATTDANVKIVDGLALADTTQTVGYNAGATANVWFKQPNTSGSVWVVQVTETKPAGVGGCSTIRRFYVSTFDFNVTIQTVLADRTTLGTNDNLDAICNSWSAKVARNALLPSHLAAMAQDSINNAHDGDLKVTSTFMRVTFTINGGSRNMSDLKFRMTWTDSLAFAESNIYRIAVATAQSASDIGIGAEPTGTNNTLAATATNASIAFATTNSIWSANNAIYFDEVPGNTTQTAEWLIEVQTHNLFNDHDQVYSMKALQVELDNAAGTNYNRGLKVAHDRTDGTPLAGSSSSTVWRIQQSPSTSIISVTE